MEALRGAEDAERLEVRRLEQELARLGPHLALLAAHHAGDRDRPLGVRDREVVGRELAHLAVERPDPLADARPPDDDAAFGKPRPVEGVQRAAEGEHHVVRHVDDVRDRPHPGREQPRLEPGRRAADGRVAEDAPDVARAALEVLDDDVDGLLAGGLRIASRGRRELGPGKRRHLARDAVDRGQVGPVVAGLDLEHVLAERQEVGERRTHLPLRRQHHDPGVVGAELELALGEDHPVRDLAAELRRLEPLPAGQDGARERDRDVRAGAEVPGAADDLARLALADVDAAELEPVGVRMLARLDHAADAEEAEVAVLVGHAAADDPVDLAAREDEPARDLLERPVERDVLAQPAGGDLHQNCARTRRSFSQKARRSGSPCRSIAIRSMPSPNANPDHSSGS